MGQRCCKAFTIEEFEVSGDEIINTGRGGGRQFVYCIRHGEREDAVNDEWITLTDRPYDPPLTAQGRMEAKKAAQEIMKRDREEWPSVVVTSPFLRCIQTAAVVFHELCINGQNCSTIIVDHQLGEIHHPQVLKTTEKQPPTFSEESIRSAIEFAIGGENYETTLEGIAPKVVFVGTPVLFPERREAAYRRYNHYFNESIPTYSNCALITHGESVSCSISSINPDLQVFNTDYCSYSIRMRADSCSPWMLLSQSGQNGIEWIDKSEIDLE
eukprot:TRINITY_DN3510_c0_g1_i1.p1 TRINITY_DN3510_c0_g1~~TRINITY_DN3510_c0_g1_i1.p1  ORF type:complete len:270 (+),score=30.83 TRINITY_DN3510_c0_g1_i1:39-848(+)